MLFLLQEKDLLMNRTVCLGITLLLLVFAPFSQGVLAGEPGWVMSIPHAISGQHIYKVRILAIDDETLAELFQYPVPAGKHNIEIELMLDVEWEPDLVDSERPPARKNFKLEVEAGKAYQLAARVNVDAPVESQLDQSFWEVFVYAVE